MGRGYSATRAGSARNVRKEKRTRSVSIQKLRDALESGKSIEEASVASEEDQDRVSDAEVMTKYKTCGRIVDEVLKVLGDATVAGANTYDLCVLGDKEVKERCGAVYKAGKAKAIRKGLSVPTNISVNSVLCHHCPFDSAEAITLKEGDIVKIHLGCHLDGFATQAARTVVVGNQMIPQDVARCIQASVVALNAMIRLLRPGEQNGPVTDVIGMVGQCYGVQPCEGVLSNRTKRWIIDGSDAIIGKRVIKEEPLQDVAECTFGPNQVWTLDVAFTTAPTHRLLASDEPTNIVRKNEITDRTRIDAGDYVLKLVQEEFFCFPFTARQAPSPLTAKLGIKALQKTTMLDVFPALKCRTGAVTTRWCCTVAITEKRVHVLSGLPPAADTDDFNCVTTPSAGIKEVLALPLDFKAPKSVDEDDDRPKSKKQRK